MVKGNGENHCRFWLIVFAASLLWFLFCYVPLSHLRCKRTDRPIGSLTQNSIVSSSPDEESTTQAPPEQDVEIEATNLQSDIANSSTRESVKSPRKEDNHVISLIPNQGQKNPSPCQGRYIYVHDLPSRFNRDLIKECKNINPWINMCKFITNSGLGPRMKRSKAVFSDNGWYATNQFTLEMIFHNRMKQYECLTSNSSMASAIFVPFYAGLDISRYLWGDFNISMRDSSSLDLMQWLVRRHEWEAMGGKDHFLVAGRITWDFRRMEDLDSYWGNKLFILREAKNMSILVIESSPWHSNDFAIPYPTYFHPAKDRDLLSWQNRVKKLKRPWLFAFAGAARPNNTISIRTQLINHCVDSELCMFLNCSIKGKCESPSSIMKMFQSSEFCLQPQGDSYTRRSAFDSILAGCIPVFFHPGSAYVQYTWHLPRNYSKYSVFIPEEAVRDGRDDIEKILRRIPKDQVRIMREEVISLIPRVIYADPRSKLKTYKDAFDISVQAVLEKIGRTRRRMEQGVYDEGYGEENSWKYGLLGEVEKTVEEHEWDHFFNAPRDEKNGGSNGLDE